MTAEIDPGAVTVGTCGECNGTREVPHSMPGETHKCFCCNGFGVVKRTDRYHGYKTAQSAAQAVKRGFGVTCGECKGSGTGTYPLTIHCYSCKDGQIITSALPGQRWEAGKALRYETARGDVWKAYREAVTIVITAENRAQTWGEAHLGLGSIVSVTDYGRRWDALVLAARSGDEGTLTAAIDTLRAEIRTELSPTQWLNVIRSDDSLAEYIIVNVTRGGYVVRGADVEYRAPWLPPSYAGVIDQPVR
jgi:hypothetical protein